MLKTVFDYFAENIIYFAKHYTSEEVEVMRKETERETKKEGARELVSAFWGCVLAEQELQAKERHGRQL